MSEPTLVSSLLCEDVLPSSLIDGRVTIYRVLFDLSAARFPARSYRLFSANFWRGGQGEYTDRDAAAHIVRRRLSTRLPRHMV